MRNLRRPTRNSTSRAPLSSTNLRMSGRLSLRTCTQSVMHFGLRCMRCQANRRHENTGELLLFADLPAPQRGEAATGWGAGTFPAGRHAGSSELGEIVGYIVRKSVDQAGQYSTRARQRIGVIRAAQNGASRHQERINKMSKTIFISTKSPKIIE